MNGLETSKGAVEDLDLECPLRLVGEPAIEMELRPEMSDGVNGVLVSERALCLLGVLGVLGVLG